MPINREKAITELSKIQVKGNEEGLIPAFGVLVNQLPINFWNTFSTKILDAAGEDLYEDASGLLTNAAHECGYHTGWGIINSDEFNAVVGPMITEPPADVLHGAYAVFTAWGWANAEITELVAGEKMVIKVNGYYEADVKDTYKPKASFAYMVCGVSAAFMDIAYGDKPYPDGMGKFMTKQTKAIELGDDYGEFVVSVA